MRQQKCDGCRYLFPFEDVSKVRTGRFLCRGCIEESGEDQDDHPENEGTEVETDEAPGRGGKRRRQDPDDDDEGDDSDDDDEDDGEEDEYEEDEYEEDDEDSDDDGTEATDEDD